MARQAFLVLPLPAFCHLEKMGVMLGLCSQRLGVPEGWIFLAEV